jgi:hypothetical protein
MLVHLRQKLLKATIGKEITNHTTYSRNFVSCDLHFFLLSKVHLGGQKFQTVDECCPKSVMQSRYNQLCCWNLLISALPGYWETTEKNSVEGDYIPKG